MISPRTAVPKCAGLRITDDYRTWSPSQAWLAEVARTVTSRIYGQMEDGINEKADRTPVAVHKAAITAQLSKIFGALYDESTPQFSGSWIVDMLVQLGDLGDIGNGYHIPRESRIVRLASGWGRIAGGLPIETSEHAPEELGLVIMSTIGRLVALRQDFAHRDRNTEHSEVFVWSTETVDQILARLLNRLPERSVSRPPEKATQYYSAGYRQGRTRGERWHNKMPTAPFVVARTGMQPTHYYVIEAQSGQREGKWFELEREDARRWVLLVEKSAGITNLIRMNNDGGTFFLPDMLPRAWTIGIMACASTVIPNGDGGWTVEVQPDGLELLKLLLGNGNIQLI